MIEAHLLFGFGLDKIDVVVHPQSIVHSMVEFYDAHHDVQASPPDMRLPISLGLNWPSRVADAAFRLDWSTAATWTFGIHSTMRHSPRWNWPAPWHGRAGLHAACVQRGE